MRSRDREAADRVSSVLSRESPDLLRYLQRRLGQNDAADAMSEVMMIVWRRVGDLPNEPEPARMWLFGVARNVVLNSQRGELRRSGLADRLRHALASSHRHAEAADAGLEVRDAIGRLPPDQAELVRLVHWDGFTVAQAGELLGVPPSTARTRYQRARQDLRAALELPTRSSLAVDPSC